MDLAWNLVTRLARVCAWIGGILLLFAAVLVSAEVVSRKLLTVVFSGSDELAAYLFATGTTWSLAHVLLTRGHVRIDALYGQLPARVRIVLDVVSLVVMGVVAFALLDRAYDLTYTNYAEWNRSNTPLRVPLALAQIPWLFGLGLFFVTILLALARTLLALARGDLLTARQTAGVAGQDEEIASELATLGIAIGHHDGEPQPARPTRVGR